MLRRTDEFSKKDIKTQRRCYSNLYRQAIPQSTPPSQKKLYSLCVSAWSKGLQVSFGHQILNFWKGCRDTVVQRDKEELNYVRIYTRIGESDQNGSGMVILATFLEKSGSSPLDQLKTSHLGLKYVLQYNELQ